MTLEGHRIVLAPVEAADSGTLFAWINDHAIVRLHGPFRPVSKAEHGQWMDRAVANGGRTVFAIREAGSRRLIGLLLLVNTHEIHRSVELRLRIGAKDDRGKGYGREAAGLACRHAFDTLAMQRVFLHVFSDNAPAIAAYEAAGFVAEGMMRKAALIEDEWKDVVVMSRLAGPSSDFTDADFRGLLEALKQAGYRFARYGETARDRHVLWRHDIDMSVHRAAALAAIEAEMGARATYFFNPRNPFYNLLEPVVMEKAQAIIAAGHDIGLHFDAATTGGPAWTREAIEAAVAAERGLLETMIGHPVTAISWHNPDSSNLLAFGDDRIAGLHNAYSARLRADYTYASDSNGYWRFRPMMDVIREEHQRLHLLTHPEWWTPAPMPVDQRIDRVLWGRTSQALARYHAVLRQHGRTHGET